MLTQPATNSMPTDSRVSKGNFNFHNYFSNIILKYYDCSVFLLLLITTAPRANYIFDAEGNPNYDYS
jgi:hypothetical protein